MLVCACKRSAQEGQKRAMDLLKLEIQGCGTESLQRTRLGSQHPPIPGSSQPIFLKIKLCFYMYAFL